MNKDYVVLTDISCYFCNSEDGECNEDNPGDLVKCQEDDTHGYHYGDACVIGHTSTRDYHTFNI